MAGAAAALHFAAHAQNSPVYPDDSVAAVESLTRTLELSAAGNLAEAARVAQQILDRDADRVIAVPGDKTLFLPVRRRVHEALLADAKLLAAYRDAETNRARSQLDSGDVASVERSRLLTRPGFEAALRVAQRQIEAARFNAALLTLRQLTTHPDLSDPACGGPAFESAELLSRYLRTPACRALVAAFAAAAKRAETNPPAFPAPPAPPTVFTPRSPNSALDRAGVSTKPLTELPLDTQESADAPILRDTAVQRVPWVLPAVVGDTVFVNDGTTLGAYDRITLTPQWTRTYAQRVATGDALSEQVRLPLASRARQFEDCPAVTVGSGVAVVVGGYAISDYRRDGDARVHAFDTSTGRELWAVEVARLDKSVEGATVRSAPLIDGDTVVLALGRLTGGRRVGSAALAGLDLSTGELRWVRPVGSCGFLYLTPGIKPSGRPIVNDGVIYHADAVGVLVAVESATGRTAWVRALSGPPSEGGMGPTYLQPWAGAEPIIDGPDLLVLSPNDGTLVRVRRDDGTILARRDTSDMGSPRYLLHSGDTIAAIGERRVVLLPASTCTNPAAPATSIDLPGTGLLQGRAVVAGDSFLVPLLDGLLLIDPKSPTTPQRIAMETSGTPLVAGGQLLLATPSGLQSHALWDVAEPVLTKAITSRPGEAAPALAFVEIATRAGRTERIAPAADQALAIFDADALSEAAQAGRSKLFDLLLGAVRTTPLAQGSILDQLLVRLSLAAEGVPHRAQAAITEARLRADQGAWVAAVEACQRVLTDAELSAAPLSLKPTEAPTAAGELATTILHDAVTKGGYGAYEPFNAQASQELAALGSTPTPEQLLALARRYPLARSTSNALLRAATALPKGENRLKALGKAFDNATLVARVTPGAGASPLPEAAGRFLTELEASGRSGEALRTLARLHAEFPTLVPAGIPDVDAWRDALRSTLRTPRLPRLGPTLTGEAQALPGWSLWPALLADDPGSAPEQFAFVATNQPQAAAFAYSTAAGRYVPLWVRSWDKSEPRPAVLKLEAEASLLLWSTSRGPVIERIDAVTGKTLWRSAEFDTLFPPVPGPETDGSIQVLTPQGRRPITQPLIACDDSRVVLLQRNGKTIVLNKADGKPVWVGRPFPGVVWDFTLCGGRLTMAGMAAEDGRTSPRTVVVNPADGSSTIVNFGKAHDLPPPWLRVVGDRVAAGLNDRVCLIDPATAQILWSATGPGLTSTSDCWVTPGQLWTLSGQGELWLINAATGDVSKSALETRDRVDSADDEGDGPTRVYAVGDQRALVSRRGVAVFDAKGRLTGVDAGGANTHGLTGVGATLAAFLSTELRTDSQGRKTAALQFVSLTTGKAFGESRIVLGDRPTTLHVNDNHLAVTAGGTTIIAETAN